MMRRLRIHRPPFFHRLARFWLVVGLLCMLGLVAAGRSKAEAAAPTSVSALGAEGELLTLRSGTWGALFPGNTGADPATWALALDVTDHDGTLRRLLVPSSADPRQEIASRLITGAGETHLLWHSVRADGRFEIRFATVRGGASAPEITAMAQVSDAEGQALIFDRAPLMAVTHDAFHLDSGTDGESPAEPGGGTVTGHYTLVHLLWRGNAAALEMDYTALTFVDGSYVGWHQLFDLGGLLGQAGDEGEGSAAVLPSALAETLDLAATNDGRSLVVTYADPIRQRLGTFEISALPMVLSVLGDGVRDEIYAAADLYDPEDLVAFVDKVKGSVIAIGHRARVHPALREYLADRLGIWVEAVAADYGFGGFLELGEDARDLTIDLSTSIFASTIEDPSAPGATIVEIDLGGLVGEGPAPQQLLDLHELVDLPAPVGPGDGSSAFAVSSADGKRLAVAWVEDSVGGGALNYVENYVEGGPEGTWSEARRLPLGPSMSVEEARRLLEDRLR